MTPELEEALKEWAGRGFPSSGATFNHLALLTDKLYPVEPPVARMWLPATLSLCLAGDRIRIGTDETDVTYSSVGGWHADTSDPYRPKRWDHVELKLDLAAHPGKRNYPPNTPCEILCSPERAAILAIQQGFPGSAVISSDVD